MQEIKTQNKQLSVQYVAVSKLQIATYNPRKWEVSAIQKLTESIKRFGLVDPIIVNGAEVRFNIVIGGHFRLKIAKDLGYKEVPVVYINIPDIGKEKELNLRLNRNTGDWDWELLKALDLGTLLDVGFDNSDLSNIWDDNLAIEDDEFDVAKAVAEVKEPKTKLGDIIVLGEHRLICGDSTDPAVIAKLVENHKISMLSYDPPYNINLDYNKGVSAKGNYGSKKVNDNKSADDYWTFLKKVLQNGLAHALPDCHVFCFCDQSYIWMLQKLYAELGIDTKRVCLWIKNNANMTPQIAFNKAYEPCVYGTVGNPYLSPIHNLNEVLNKEVGTGNRLTDDIMDLFDIWLAKRVAGQNYEHPTQKPPTLYEKAIRRCSKPGDIIFDLFGGSGSQLIAAEQLKRRAFLCEIDPVFCDVIVARYQELTGKEAIYADSTQ